MPISYGNNVSLSFAGAVAAHPGPLHTEQSGFDCVQLPSGSHAALWKAVCTVLAWNWIESPEKVMF